jgi:hypothetical protein
MAARKAVSDDLDRRRPAVEGAAPAIGTARRRDLIENATLHGDKTIAVNLKMGGIWLVCDVKLIGARTERADEKDEQDRSLKRSTHSQHFHNMRFTEFF